MIGSVGLVEVEVLALMLRWSGKICVEMIVEKKIDVFVTGFGFFLRDVMCTDQPAVFQRSLCMSETEVSRDAFKQKASPCERPSTTSQI